jgi:hypothetical protein
MNIIRRIFIQHDLPDKLKHEMIKHGTDYVGGMLVKKIVTANGYFLVRGTNTLEEETNGVYAIIDLEVIPVPEKDIIVAKLPDYSDMSYTQLAKTALQEIWWRITGKEN